MVRKILRGGDFAAEFSQTEGFQEIFRFRLTEGVLWDGNRRVNRVRSTDFGRLAQRQSIGLTHRGSQVQILYRPPVLSNNPIPVIEFRTLAHKY